MSSKDLVEHISARIHSITAEKEYRADLSVNKVKNGANSLIFPEICAVTADVAAMSNVMKKSRRNMSILRKKKTQDPHLEKGDKGGQTKPHGSSSDSPQDSPKGDQLASNYPQPSREAISKRLTESVWEVMDAIAQTPPNAEAPRRPLLLIEEWLSGDAALGFTPSVVLAGLTNLLHVLSRSIHLKADPLLATRGVETNDPSADRGSFTCDEALLTKAESKKKITPHDSTVAKFSASTPIRHDSLHQKQQIDFANIHPETFLPPLVHRSRTLPAWPNGCTATQDATAILKNDISGKSFDNSASKHKAACHASSVEVATGSHFSEGIHSSKGGSKISNQPQNAAAVLSTLAEDNFTQQQPHYTAEALEMLLTFCAKPLILLTLEDQQILSKAAYCLFEALAQVIKDVSAYFSLLSASQLETSVKEESKSIQTTNQDAIVAVSLTSQQVKASSKIAQGLHLAALRAMQSLITQLYPQCDPAHFHSPIQPENAKRRGVKKGVHTSVRHDRDPSLAAKSTALCEFLEYLLHLRGDCANEDGDQEMGQDLRRSYALDTLMEYWHSLLMRSNPETHEPRDHTFLEKESEASKASMSKATDGPEDTIVGGAQREGGLSTEEELKAVLQIFERLFSSAKEAFEQRASHSKAKRGTIKKKNFLDIAQFPSAIPILTVYTIGMYVNTQTSVASHCMDLLSLLVDIAPSATSLTLLDRTNPPHSELHEDLLNGSAQSTPFSHIFHTLFSLLTMPHSQSRLELLNDMLLLVDTVLRYDTDGLMGLEDTAWFANGSTMEERPEAGSISPPTVDAVNVCMLLIFNAVCKDDLSSFTKRYDVWKAMDMTLSSFCGSMSSKPALCSGHKIPGTGERSMSPKQQRPLLRDALNDDASEGVFRMLQSIRLPKVTAMSSQEMRRELLYLKRLGWEVLERFMEWQSTHAEVAALQRDLGMNSLEKNKGAIYEGYYFLDLCSMGFLEVLFMYTNKGLNSNKNVDASGAETTGQAININSGLSDTDEDVKALQLEAWELLTSLVNHVHRLRELFLSLKEKNFFIGEEYRSASGTPACIYMNECSGRMQPNEKNLACDHYDYNFDDNIVSMGGVLCAMRCLDKSRSALPNFCDPLESGDVMINSEQLRDPLCRAVLTFLTFLSRSGTSRRGTAEAFLGIPHLTGIVINSLEGIRCHYNFTFKPKHKRSRGSVTDKEPKKNDSNSVFFLPDAASNTTLLLLDLLKNLGAIAEVWGAPLSGGAQTPQRLSDPVEPAPSTCPGGSASKQTPNPTDSVSREESEALPPLSEEGPVLSVERIAFNEMGGTNVEEDAVTFHSVENSSHNKVFSDAGGVDMLLNWIQLILSPCPRNALNVTGFSSTYSGQQGLSVLPPLDETLSRYGPLLASLLHVLQNFVLNSGESKETFVESEGVLVLLDAAESLAVVSGILGEDPVKNPENASSCREDTTRSKILESASTMIASSFVAKDSPLQNFGLERLRMELKIETNSCFEGLIQNFISYCKSLLGYTLTIVSDLAHTSDLAREYFMLWRSRRLQVRSDKFVESSTVETGINAVQLLVSVWEFSLRENFARPRENDSGHPCTAKESNARSDKWSFGETGSGESAAGLGLLRVFIREKINVILRQVYIRRLAHRRVALGLLPSSICTAGAPSLTNSDSDAGRTSCSSDHESMENVATLLQYYIFVKQGRWVPSRVKGEGIGHGNTTMAVEDLFESDDEKQFALKEALTWLNTKATVNASFIMEAISVWLKEHLILGVKVYSCLAALGFEHLISIVVAKDIENRTIHESGLVLPHSAKRLKEEKESSSTANSAVAALTMKNTRELPLTSAERSHIVAMASIPSLCIDELCLAMSSTANIFPNTGDVDEGCWLDHSIAPQNDNDPNAGLIRPTTTDERYLRGILPDVLKRGQEVCELINLGHNLEQTYQSQKLDRFLITRLSYAPSDKQRKVRNTIVRKEKVKEATLIAEIAEGIRQQLFS